MVTIKIKEENGKLVYTKRIKKIDSIKTRFDIQEFPAGEYTFELVKNRKVLYSKKISKSENVVAATQ